MTFIKFAKRLLVMAGFARSMKDPAKFSTSLRTIGDKLETSLVRKSSVPYLLTKSNTALSLPETFVTEGKTRNTKEYLKEVNCDGILILIDGKVVHEQYYNGMQPQDRHMSFSVGKSMASTVVGLALDHGVLDSVDDLVVKYVPELKNTGFDGVTLAQCLEMSSGADFQEDYEEGAPSDMPRFQKHSAFHKPYIDFVKTIGRDKAPGTYNGYSSMDALVLGLVVDHALGDKNFAEFMHESLWEPIGAEQDAKWAVDPTGAPATAGGFFACLRDYAKFGQLFLQNGQWEGKQLISEAWVKQATTPHAPHLMPGKRDDCLKPWGYGYLWWTPEFPYGGDFFASGIHSQYVYVNPEKNIVIATVSANTRFYEKPEGYKLHHVDLFQAIAKSV
ncbi:hypothetical protein R50073_13390 [Maricurvus nonylphenolicus]|uniref:serine hydrolase domain-containing protein n=1 Tax=Maricurvus nonylphenolicus TaxID=1008307 RepID=UPI0036F1BC5B